MFSPTNTQLGGGRIYREPKVLSAVANGATCADRSGADTSRRLVEDREPGWWTCTRLSTLNREPRPV